MSSWNNGINLLGSSMFPRSKELDKKKKTHVIDQLYDRGMDFNVYDGKPHGSFMLATIPRSGSTFCAIKLWQSGLLGAPMEYLNFRVMGPMFARLGYEIDVDGYIESSAIWKFWSNIQRIRTAPNGMFGYKMFSSNYREISIKYPEFLNEISPNYVIYLTRSDRLGQAISYSRAQKSKIWFGGVNGAPVPDYDFKHIRGCLNSIQIQKLFWEKVFKLVEITPFRTTYEELLYRNESVVDSILIHMGIQPDKSCALSIPCIIKQADAISEEWRYRFLDEANDLDLSIINGKE